MLDFGVSSTWDSHGMHAPRIAQMHPGDAPRGTEPCMAVEHGGTLGNTGLGFQHFSLISF